MRDLSKLTEQGLPFVQEDVQGSKRTKAMHFASWELQSRMRVDEPDALDVEYTRTMMGFLLFNAVPRSIAMIGLGGGSLAKFCHRHLPGAHTTAVEINPHVIALRDEFCVPPDGERFQVIEGDGAEFLARTEQRFDVLMVDGFDDAGMPDRLATQAFYDHCHQALTPDGLLVVNLHDQHPQLEVFIGRIERSFGAHVLKVAVKREGNSVVFASRRALVGPQWGGAVLRPPPGFDARAWADLLPTLKQVMESLHCESLPSARRDA